MVPTNATVNLVIVVTAGPVKTLMNVTPTLAEITAMTSSVFVLIKLQVGNAVARRVTKETVSIAKILTNVWNQKILSIDITAMLMPHVIIKSVVLNAFVTTAGKVTVFHVEISTNVLMQLTLICAVSTQPAKIMMAVMTAVVMKDMNLQVPYPTMKHSQLFIMGVKILMNATAITVATKMHHVMTSISN